MRLELQQTTLRQILQDEGFMGWGVFERVRFSTDGNESIWRLFNFEARREAKISIPVAWLYDRRRDHAIAELLMLAIDHCSYDVPISERKSRTRK